MIWGLVDDRTGHTAQVLGVVAQLALPYQLKRLEFNWLGRHAPSRLLGASLCGIDHARSAPLSAPWPKLAIAAGRRTLPALRYIKRRSPATNTVYLMWPGDSRFLDLVVAPVYDNPPSQANVITTLAPLHAVTPERLESAADAWRAAFAHLPRPWVMVSLGGATKRGGFSQADWATLLDQAQALAAGGSLLITTSRRTPAEAMALVQHRVTAPHYFHQWDATRDNPYLGMLGLADMVIVTGDSLSMCTEACASGKPVFIFAPPATLPEKHRALHAALYAQGRAQPLTDSVTPHWQPVGALNEAAQVAAVIRARFAHALGD